MQMDPGTTTGVQPQADEITPDGHRQFEVTVTETVRYTKTYTREALDALTEGQVDLTMTDAQVVAAIVEGRHPDLEQSVQDNADVQGSDWSVRVLG